MAHQLHPVADAKDRNALFEDLRRDARRALGEHARRPTAENDRARLQGLERIEVRGARMDLAEDILLTNPPRDELRVLGTEVEDQDGSHASAIARSILRAEAFAMLRRIMRCGVC